jgi:hypothetical protein
VRTSQEKLDSHGKPVFGSLSVAHGEYRCVECNGQSRRDAALGLHTAANVTTPVKV